MASLASHQPASTVCNTDSNHSSHVHFSSPAPHPRAREVHGPSHNLCAVTAWRPRDLELLLRMHRAYGRPYRPPGFHSGYNEVILSSARFNARLPSIIDAFFVLDGANANADATGMDVVRAHRNFLSRYRIREGQVPLLKLNASRWEAPFSVLDLVPVRVAHSRRRGSARSG